MAPVFVILNDLEGHSPRSFPVCMPFQVQFVEQLCSSLPDFNWQRARAVPRRQLGLSSSVKLHGRRTISGRLLAFSFVATVRLLSNYFDLLLPTAARISEEGLSVRLYFLSFEPTDLEMTFKYLELCVWLGHTYRPVHMTVRQNHAHK